MAPPDRGAGAVEWAERVADGEGAAVGRDGVEADAACGIDDRGRGGGDGGGVRGLPGHGCARGRQRGEPRAGWRVGERVERHMRRRDRHAAPARERGGQGARVGPLGGG